MARRTSTETLEAGLELAGVLSPAQITSNQNNYNPSGLAAAFLLRLNTDASRIITGLAGGTEGQLKSIRNVGSFPIVLSDADAGSTAANRFSFGQSLTLQPGQQVLLDYDNTTARWICLGISVGQNAMVVQAFTSSGTWTNDVNASLIEVICIGSGSGGAGGKLTSAGVNAPGGAGGSGGARVTRMFKPSDLTATVSVTVPSGGAGSAGAANPANGGVGSNTTFGAYVTAYGGGAPSGSVANTSTASGGAGSIFSQGNDASGATAGTGSIVNGVTGGTVGAGSIWPTSGATGGGCANAGVGQAGGSALDGGAGGGAGGGTAGAAAKAGGAGGSTDGTAGPTGGAGSIGGVGTNGTSASTPTAIGQPGQGGGGGGNSQTNTAGNGGNGAVGSGGGGGGSSQTGAAAGTGGNGGAGKCWVITYY